MDEADEDRPQIESPIEAVLRFGEIAIRVLGEVEGMVGPCDRGLEVAKHGVHVAKLRMQHSLSAAAGFDGVIANDFGGQASLDAGQYEDSTEPSGLRGEVLGQCSRHLRAVRLHQS